MVAAKAGRNSIFLKGHNKDLYLEGNILHFHYGFKDTAWGSGKRLTDKDVPLSRVASMEMKESGLFRRGYLRIYLEDQDQNEEAKIHPLAHELTVVFRSPSANLRAYRIKDRFTRMRIKNLLDEVEKKAVELAKQPDSSSRLAVQKSRLSEILTAGDDISEDDFIDIMRNINRE